MRASKSICRLEVAVIPSETAIDRRFGFAPESGGGEVFLPRFFSYQLNSPLFGRYAGRIHKAEEHSFHRNDLASVGPGSPRVPVIHELAEHDSVGT